jgi:hypothetical protein
VHRHYLERELLSQLKREQGLRNQPFADGLRQFDGVPRRGEFIIGKCELICNDVHRRSASFSACLTFSAARRERIATVGVALPDAAVPAVHEEFGILVPGDLPPGINRILLGLVDGAGPAATGSPNGPSVLMWHNVLVAASHCNLL